jgi:hypothetical protein
MSRPLTTQELHNLAMNIVGKDLEKRGYEFIAVNSQLKKNPQFVCIDQQNRRFFVIVKAGIVSEAPIQFDVIWMETFKAHARKNNATVLFAGVGLGHPDKSSLPPNLNETYLLHYEGLQRLDIELN